MTLGDLIEQISYYDGAPVSTAHRIEKARTKLFDFDYPIFDDNYKKVFETHFIRNFYMREIGYETEGLFKFYLETWLQIHMPYFNKLFESELIEFDPLENSNMDSTHNKRTDKTKNDTLDSKSKTSSVGKSDTTTEGSADSTTTEDNFSRELESNNPDSRLAITTNDGQGVIEYASKIDEESENNTVTGNTSTSATENTNINNTDDTTRNDTAVSEINDVEDFIMHRAGKIGVQTYSKMLQEYRQSFIRIEKQMFEEMQQLFMLVY